MELGFADGVSSLAAAEWNALVGDASPFLEWEWLASLEAGGAVGEASGWQPCPLVARDASGRLLAAAPVYRKHNSEGEFVFDFAWADAAARAGIDYYPKLLVAVPFTPVTGTRFLVAPDQDRGKWISRLAQALRDACDDGRHSSAHVNFCQPDELNALSGEGYLPRIGVQYHWRNQDYRSFDEYLERFRSKRRKQIRRERRSLADHGIEVETCSGDEITDAMFETMFEFYVTNVRQHYWGRQYLTRRVFEQLREHFRHRLCFGIARAGGEVIAGTFNVAKDGVLYGRYWGARSYVPFLHFNLCYYSLIEYCIERGFNRFEAGAGGDYKQLRGLDAQPTLSAHHLADPRLADAVSRYLEGERQEYAAVIHWLQEHSALKPEVVAGAGS